MYVVSYIRISTYVSPYSLLMPIVPSPGTYVIFIMELTVDGTYYNRKDLVRKY